MGNAQAGQGRRLSDIVYRTMLGDALKPDKDAGSGATATERTGPGGHSGAATNSSAVDSNPGIRRFGEVTSRTHHQPAYDQTANCLLKQRGARVASLGDPPASYRHREGPGCDRRRCCFADVEVSASSAGWGRRS
jgi:hypothetical protein